MGDVHYVKRSVSPLLRSEAFGTRLPGVDDVDDQELLTACPSSSTLSYQTISHHCEEYASMHTLGGRLLDNRR